ncbi:MAG: hypothetical protein ACT4PZ_16490 [Panacagrimonas sp.]
MRISHPGDVAAAVLPMLSSLYPGLDLDPLRKAYRTFTQLYVGELPGYVGCDTWYHDAQHSLDCSLAVARLLDGHERSVEPEQRLGPRRAVLGIVIALFHDAGYVRSTRDAAHNGAEYTLSHVRRSGDFLAGFLPTVGYAAEAALAQEVVHFTGWEMPLNDIRVSDPKDRMLGFMLGTADLLAQTADRCYLEKCRDYLFREFEVAGLAGTGKTDTRYPTVESLLQNTPDFNRQLWRERLDGYFGSAYRYMDKHFGGGNPYVEQIQQHLALIAKLGSKHQFQKLKRRPRRIDAQALRQLLGLKVSKCRARRVANPSASAPTH